MKDRVVDFAKKNETTLNILFFLGGVLFDIFTLDEIDSFFSIGQQVGYLILLGLLLYFDFLSNFAQFQFPKKIQKIWKYKDFIIHFFIGSLLSIYSIFFIKSASVISSMIFIIFMLTLLVLNELKMVQQKKAGLKIGLYLICVFSFFSILWPIVFGFVGPVPFAAALTSTAVVIWFLYKLISKKIEEKKIITSGLAYPTLGVLGIFGMFYYMGWIPPVPLSVKEVGIYHNVEKDPQTALYKLYYESPKWKFWLRGDQNFKSRPGDKVYVFTRIFSPARFSDKVIIHWQQYHEKKGWLSTDRIPMQISGGRREGFRGYTYKENFTEGEWRVLIETLDQREIGRIHFEIQSMPELTEERIFNVTLR